MFSPRFSARLLAAAWARTIGCTQGNRRRWPSSGIEAVMRTRAHRRKVWLCGSSPAAQPIDTVLRRSALIARRRPFRWLAWTVRTHWRPIFLVTGTRFAHRHVDGAAQHQLAFVPGMVVLGLAAPDARSDAGLFYSHHGHGSRVVARE